MKTLKPKRGSITVEAAVIVPIVIIAVMVVIYIMLIIFQSCIMQVTANSLSEKAAAVWLNQYASLETGKTSKADISNTGLYRRWSFGSSRNEVEVCEEAKTMLQKYSILKGKDVEVNISHQNTIFAQKITVELSAAYTNPLGGLTDIWGLDSSVKLRVQSHSTVDDPVEFIRNSDFIIETAASIPLINEFESKWSEIVDKIIEYVKNFGKGETAS